MITDKKYVVVNIDGKDAIVTFPKSIDHDRLYEALRTIRFGHGRDWCCKLRSGPAVSAGFVTNGICHGRSETLNLDTRGAVDTALLS